MLFRQLASCLWSVNLDTEKRVIASKPEGNVMPKGVTPKLSFNHIMQAAPWRKEVAEYYVDPITGEQCWIASDSGISDPAWRDGQPTIANARPSSPFKRCKPNGSVTVERITRKKFVKP